MKKIKSNIGFRIRKIREHKNLTRDRLAEISNVSIDYLYAIEHKNKNISIDILKKLCIALDVSSDYIIFGYEKKGAPSYFIDEDEKINKNQFEIEMLINKLNSLLE